MKTSNTQNTKKITLYCLPYAGGHSLSYREFQANVADNILIKPLELPGRGKRIKEPLLTNLETMVDDLFLQIENELNDKPYAIYGHSMGTLLGYLLTKRILSAGKPAPLHLFVSGRNAPSVIKNTIPRHKLPKQEFLNYLNELGGLQQEILECTELMDFLEPILRADFQAIETYTYQQTSPFEIPISILYGLEDKELSSQDLLAWQQESSQPITIKSFPGGHFFIFEQLPQIGQVFSKTLILNQKKS